MNKPEWKDSSYSSYPSWTMNISKGVFIKVEVADGRKKVKEYVARVNSYRQGIGVYPTVGEAKTAAWNEVVRRYKKLHEVMKDLV